MKEQIKTIDHKLDVIAGAFMQVLGKFADTLKDIKIVLADTDNRLAQIEKKLGIEHKPVVKK